MKEVEDDAMVNHERSVANADFYKVQKAAEANLLLYTPEYLKLEMMRSLGNSTKIYFGPSLHNLLIDFLELLNNNSPLSKKN